MDYQPTRRQFIAVLLVVGAVALGGLTGREATSADSGGASDTQQPSSSNGDASAAGTEDPTTSPDKPTQNASEDFSIAGVWKVTDCREQGVGQAWRRTGMPVMDVSDGQ